MVAVWVGNRVDFTRFDARIAKSMNGRGQPVGAGSSAVGDFLRYRGARPRVFGVIDFDCKVFLVVGGFLEDVRASSVRGFSWACVFGIGSRRKEKMMLREGKMRGTRGIMPLVLEDSSIP